MPGESTVKELLKKLAIPEERAQELIDQIWELAAKYGDPAFLVEEWTTLYELATTPMEAFFIGHVATLIADSVAAVMTPIEWLNESVQVAMKLQAAQEEKARRN